MGNSVTVVWIILRIALAALVLTLLPATAQTAAAARQTFPDRIELPDGFLPEGITIARRHRTPTAWFGSRADGDIYAANLRTGRGKVIHQGPGTASVGLKIDKRARLFVAGGPTGTARVVDARSGALLRDYPLTTGESFVNDVLLTKSSVWLTDSRQAQLYRLKLGRKGSLPAPGDVQRLPLRGEWTQAPSGTNSANGISTTPDERALLVIDSATATLFRVNPRTGTATSVDLRGVPMTNGDGLLREGRTLYVVQNRLNRVAVVSLDRSGRSGKVKRYLTSDDFEVPTTVARFGKSLWLPNAKFGSPDQIEFWATRIDRR